MKEIHTDQITQAVARLCVESNYYLGEDVLSALRAYREAEVSPVGREVLDQILENADIVRNRMKIEAAISNANAFLSIADEFGSFDDYIWGFVDGTSIQTNIGSFSEMPAETDLSRLISKDMKARGFRFVGPTIVYALMQAIGMVNDHLVGCPRHEALSK